MLTHYRTLTPASRLQEAVDLVLTGSQQDFRVVRDGLVEGMLTRSDLVAALEEGWSASSPRTISASSS